MHDQPVPAQVVRRWLLASIGGGIAPALRGGAMAVAVVLAAAAVRALAALCDLWFDEIWSLRRALRLAHPLYAAGEAHDNNHILNTIWLATLGAQRPEWLYRLPNVAAGAGSVLIAGALAARAGRAGQLVTMLLFASSQLLVTHSSEARGYGPMIFFSLLALLVLERQLDRADGRRLLPLFWAAILLAALGHLSAVFGYVALALYWLARRLQDGARRELVGEGLRLHLVPGLGLLALYVLFVARMKVGGGYEMGSGQAVLVTAALTLGLGPTAEPAFAPLLVVVLASSLALLDLVRGRDLRWLLLLLGMLLPPLAMFASGIAHASQRYLLLSVVFFLLLIGTASGRWIARGGAARAGCLVLVTFMIALNVMGDAELIRRGRGQYRAALAFMLARRGSGPVTVTSDHDFRNPMIIGYYAGMHPEGARVRYHSAARLPPHGAEWLILHRVAGDPTVPADHVSLGGQSYDKRLALPCAETSGMSWYVFERSSPK